MTIQYPIPNRLNYTSRRGRDLGRLLESKASLLRTTRAMEQLPFEEFSAILIGKGLESAHVFAKRHALCISLLLENFLQNLGCHLKDNTECIHIGSSVFPRREFLRSIVLYIWLKESHIRIHDSIALHSLASDDDWTRWISFRAFRSDEIWKISGKIDIEKSSVDPEMKKIESQISPDVKRRKVSDDASEDEHLDHSFDSAEELSPSNANSAISVPEKVVLEVETTDFNTDDEKWLEFLERNFDSQESEGILELETQAFDWLRSLPTSKFDKSLERLSNSLSLALNYTILRQFCEKLFLQTEVDNSISATIKFFGVSQVSVVIERIFLPALTLLPANPPRSLCDLFSQLSATFPLPTMRQLLSQGLELNIVKAPQCEIIVRLLKEATPSSCLEFLIAVTKTSGQIWDPSHDMDILLRILDTAILRISPDCLASSIQESLDQLIQRLSEFSGSVSNQPMDKNVSKRLSNILCHLSSNPSYHPILAQHSSSLISLTSPLEGLLKKLALKSLAKIGIS